MRNRLLIALASLALPALAQTANAPQQWVLGKSTLTYHISHPLHEVDGASHDARGKGVCKGTVCEFLVAAAVKSFDSGDSNRDLHMLQVTRGAQYPIVTLRFRMPENEVNAPTIRCDPEVQFAGHTAHYTGILFQQTVEGNEHHITGSIPATLTDFHIDPPTFFTVPIKNEIPVRVDTTWHPQ